MPTANVEVISPDLETVDRIAMKPGQETTVAVPSEKSFIRLHLPSGRKITLQHHGSLNYAIGREVLERSSSRKSDIATPSARKSLRDVRTYNRIRSLVEHGSMVPEATVLLSEIYGGQSAPQSLHPGNQLPLLHGEIRAEWEPNVDGRLSADGAELSFEPTQSNDRPYQLRIEVAGAKTLTVRLPGTIKSAFLRSDEIGSVKTVVSLRVSTTSEFSDMAGGYLLGADYFAADAMTEWAGQAKSNLQDKLRDPFAATIAAYLLLRLGRFDLMRDWARNLADWFPEIPDGSIIWATQCVLQKRDRDEAWNYFDKAISRGMPIHTEGLRLLTKNLRKMGEEGLDALKSLESETGRVIWNSPFTARQTRDSTGSEFPLLFDIDYAPRA